MKLKTILQSKKLFIFLTIIVIIISLIRIITPKKEYYSKSTKEVIGTIIDITKEQDKTTLIIQGKEKIRGTIYHNKKDLSLGDKVLVTGKISKPEKNTTKNLFNYRFYLETKKIHHLIKIDKIKIIKTNKNIFYNLKEFLINCLTNPYEQAFLLGITDNIKEEVKTSYEQNGISHLFAISGMQFYMIANFLEKILNKLKVNQKLSYLIIIIILFFYTLILGLSASILRGVLFYTLWKLNKIAKLNLAKEILILITLIITLLLNPYFLCDVAFYYSFIISIGLLYFLTPNTSYFKTLLISSYLSFLISIPISLYFFYQINILSIFYNLFYIPYVNIIIFPMTIITSIFKPFIVVYELLIDILENTSLFLTKIKFGTLIFPKTTIIIYLIEGLLIYLFITKKNKIIKILTIIFFLIHYLIPYTYQDFIKIIDVGQGDSALLYSKGEALLIDTGGNIYSKDSVAKYKIIPLLKSLGIKKLKFALLTHGDYDHMGDIFYLNNNFKIEKIKINLGSKKEIEKEISKWQKTSKSKQDELISLGNFKTIELNKAWQEENTSSSIYYVMYKNLNVLFLGDATKISEKYIIKNYNLKPDIIKLAHHGSNTSTSTKLLKELSPKLTIISVGKNNRYNHPSKEVLLKLEKYNIPNLKTKDVGTITIYPKNQTITTDGNLQS